MKYVAIGYLLVAVPYYVITNMVSTSLQNFQHFYSNIETIAQEAANPTK